MKKLIILFFILVFGLQSVAQAEPLALVVAEDRNFGYNRAAFKHWIDADKNGCDTRAEVLIEEAIVKPKIGAKCKLTGGKWISSYDGRTITNASQLDVDHLVPLAEAWRSGAYRWTPEQRQNFANDLDNKSLLVAVSASSNRSKGDKDPSKWTPQTNKCEYLKSWIEIKAKYQLTADEREFAALVNHKAICNLNLISESQDVQNPPPPIITQESWTSEFNQSWVWVKMAGPADLSIPAGFRKAFSIKSDNSLTTIINDQQPVACFKGNSALRNDRTKDSSQVGGFYQPSGVNTELHIDDWSGEVISCLLNPSYNFKISYKIYQGSGFFDKSKIQKNSIEYEVVASRPLPTPTPSPTPTPAIIVTPGAFCSPAGAIGKSSSGVTYTCTTSPTDSRNRWRQ